MPATASRSSRPREHDAELVGGRRALGREPPVVGQASPPSYRPSAVCVLPTSTASSMAQVNQSRRSVGRHSRNELVRVGPRCFDGVAAAGRRPRISLASRRTGRRGAHASSRSVGAGRAEGAPMAEASGDRPAPARGAVEGQLGRRSSPSSRPITSGTTRPSPSRFAGPPGVRANIERYLAGFPGRRASRSTTRSPRATRSRRAGPARGTHTGEVAGIAATGKEVTVSGLTISRLEGDMVVEEWTTWDTLGMLVQLGAVAAGSRPETRPRSAPRGRPGRPLARRARPCRCDGR